MLTILHELKQHISQGVVRKDEFKIVYVAPMKALAAEMVRNFGQRLGGLGITVQELTGDMQLSKAEILKTQMLVTTPEKWDVVTRKSTGDVALTQIVRLLIIDEVHLLHDDRGAVIESLVARTLRQVETSQTMIRIVGLSATLPNYLDVARFLRVNRKKGLFFFDGRFRPVPLAQTFIGIKSTNRMQQLQDFNNVCYDKVIEQVRNGHQVMVFVHARNETVRTASVLCEMAKNKGHITLFAAEKSSLLGEALKQVGHSRNRQLRELFPEGFAMHHAGMLRQDRNLVERYFAQGLIRVIVCTATLAWGVNLPAHAVVIKGTQIYDAKRGSFVDLGILDVMQIFGRAGRPQYDTFGHGTILTTHDKLGHYLSLLTQQNPIESQFVNSLTDNLNAEIVLGTVSNVDEAVRWLSYTYLYIRMMCNPLVYGISYQDLQTDPTLENWRRELVIKAARELDKAQMVRFTERTGLLFATDLGRTASHYYIKYDTVEVFNELFAQMMTEEKILEMVSRAQEFDQIKVRDEELDELDKHRLQCCHTAVAGGSENVHGKVNILLQTYISRAAVDNFSLVSDQAYVVQNASRIVRALFEIALRKNWPLMAGRLLKLSKVVEKRLWDWEHPLRQFAVLPPEIANKIEERGLSVEKLREMSATEIGHMIHHVNMGSRVKSYVDQIPILEVDASVQPITRTILRVVLKLTAAFKWNDRIHGKIGEPFWIWIEDPDNNHIYHSEYFMMHKKHVQQLQPQSLVFTVPIFEPLPSQYYIRVVSDRWLGSDTTQPVSFQHLILPEKHPPHTDLLDLQPLPITALGDPNLEALYSFTHFNPVQTQIFHPLYHSDVNILLGAPTGSGKTVAAELAIFRVFRERPESKAVYIAPLKALVRERMDDWKVRIEQKLGKKVVELTGDVAPDMKAVARADLIVTTPEKWDGISRSWQTRSYVKSVTLLVIDEIHLLGNDRGPVLEVIVSRTNFISSHTECPVRIVGLSTALANARDLADWLGIRLVGLYNFRPSVRPVPLEVHIQGFPGKHYCPRMATMNKPTFQAIKQHSPEKPVLVFVSSRRQTRLTALDLIAYLAADDNPKQWLHMAENEMENIIIGIRDVSLKLTLAFGIGLHHAGLHENDRKTVEALFVNQKIQVLIATSTLAWGVNFPAHLVVVKGTEYYDGKTKKYVDFPITDVLQMMGRAGRPQFDNQGVAVILVHDVKKHFYKKFLYEPFPVESNLLEVLPDHLNAEIVAGTITSKQDAMDYITWTYFFRRLLMNPTFYKLDDTTSDQVNVYLSRLVQQAVTRPHTVVLYRNRRRRLQRVG
jgi:activating signal cointegrator complex subunit 3